MRRPRRSRTRELDQHGWYRTEAYYASGGWRATWKGEGGGVLLNQCLHNLDTMQWLGRHAQTRARLLSAWALSSNRSRGQCTAYMEWANGATGVFLSSTGEAPGTNRFRNRRHAAAARHGEQQMLFTRNERDMIKFSETAKQGFVKPEVWNVEIPFENAAIPHAIMVQNFVNAILDGEPLIAPGAEGIHSVELANVMVIHRCCTTQWSCRWTAQRGKKC
jgi:predicted dehydrogenase